jgi:CRISPR/Cas system-associated protein Cas5 (RAMP superfamily)
MKYNIPFDQMKKLFGGSHIVEQSIPLIAPSTILGILRHGTERKNYKINRCTSQVTLHY